MQIEAAAGRSADVTPSFDGTATLWAAVDRLVDRSPGDLDDLIAHGLHVLAARRWRELGRGLPPRLVELERRAAAVVLGATIALERAREAYDGTMLLMKGLEVAERYPNPALRPLRDVDLLVDDPERAQRALVAAGFEPVGEDDGFYADRHHLRPLHLPGFPIVVELHRHPQWIRWAPAPSLAELAAAAVPSATGIDGLLAPTASHHALLVAAHSWSGAPLRRILDLIDVALLAQGVDPAEVWEAARRWDVEGVWNTTCTAAEAVLFGGPAVPWHVRLWAGDLFRVEERTVFANHLRRIVSAFSALPPRRAVPAAAAALVREFRPDLGETWSEKLRRSYRALRSPLRPISRQSRGRRRG